MKKNIIINRYKKGDFVCAKVRPYVILVVRLYIRKIYYCTVLNNPSVNELVDLDCELKPYRGKLSILKQINDHH
mgnify:CR=1 FL=1